VCSAGPANFRRVTSKREPEGTLRGLNRPRASIGMGEIQRPELKLLAKVASNRKRARRAWRGIDGPGCLRCLLLSAAIMSAPASAARHRLAESRSAVSQWCLEVRTLPDGHLPSLLSCARHLSTSLSSRPLLPVLLWPSRACSLWRPRPTLTHVSRGLAVIRPLIYFARKTSKISHRLRPTRHD
jgi:hypothetical protein